MTTALIVQILAPVRVQQLLPVVPIVQVLVSVQVQAVVPVAQALAQALVPNLVPVQVHQLPVQTVRVLVPVAVPQLVPVVVKVQVQAAAAAHVAAIVLLLVLQAVPILVPLIVNLLVKISVPADVWALAEPVAEPVVSDFAAALAVAVAVSDAPALAAALAATDAVDAVDVAIPVLLLVEQERICKVMEQIKERTSAWLEGTSKNVTFIVTKDCQLACKYCYLVGKNAKERMSFETAKQAIDYLLNNRALFNESSVVWDFIGGEPFLEIDLIDKICDYIKIQLYTKNHPWFNSYRFSFSTNGINYHDEKIQRYIEKNHNHLSIGITIDGTPIKHDLNRVYKNGKGSYNDVVRNIPLWIEQFPHVGTKVTISSADIPYIKESVLHLYSLGIKEVNINCVFEDVWQENDNLLYEDQLIQLADAIIDGEYYKEYACSFFAEHIGKPMDKVRENQNWCGSGKMLAVDAAGMFYPCTRFAQYSLRNKKAAIIGNVSEGVNQNRLRPFLTLNRCAQSSQECIECEVASGCAWCQAENYDAAETNTIYQRATAICKMHKARVRANNYYWNKLYRKLELEGKRESFKKKETFVIC